MVNKTVAQENIVRPGVRPNPLHQRIVSVLKLDEVAVVDREQVDRAAQENRERQGGAASDQEESASAGGYTRAARGHRRQTGCQRSARDSGTCGSREFAGFTRGRT